MKGAKARARAAAGASSVHAPTLAELAAREAAAAGATSGVAAAGGGVAAAFGARTGDAAEPWETAVGAGVPASGLSFRVSASSTGTRHITTAGGAKVPLEPPRAAGDAASSDDESRATQESDGESGRSSGSESEGGGKLAWVE